MLETLKSAVRRIAPGALRPHRYFASLARKKTGRRVISGPFEGMRYIDHSIGSAYIPKLLGIYERELHQIVEAIVGASPSLIVDVGAAEGYYAVGLARRIPGACVVAFEMSPDGRDALAEMASLNRVTGQVSVLGACETPEELSGILAGKGPAVVIMDVEGYENALLDPTKIPELEACTILLELHEFAVPGITDTIRRRFEDTHELELIWAEDRSSVDFPWRTPISRLLPGRYTANAASEWRPPGMAWYFMRPLRS